MTAKARFGRLPLAVAVLVLAGLVGAEALAEAPKQKPKQEEDVPHFFNLGADDGTDVLNMSCKGAPPFAVIECDFLQIGVSRRDDETFAKERAESKKQLEDSSEAEVLKSRELLKKLREPGKPLITPDIPERESFAKWNIALFEAIAACHSKQCVIDATMKHYDEGRSTCKITTHNFTATFQRTGPHKWISSPGPQGACNVVVVSTLENSEEYPMLWTYSYTTVTADKEKPCDAFAHPGRTHSFSWHHAFPTLRMDCQFLDFGPL